MRGVNILKVPVGNINADVLYSENIIQKQSAILASFHFHHYIECHIVITGSCDITAEKKKYNLTAGDICIIPKLFAHNVENISEDLKKCALTVSIEREKKENDRESLFLNSVFNIKDVIVVNDKKLCDWLVENISESNGENEFKNVKMKAVLSFFLVRLCEKIHSLNKLNFEDSDEYAFDERIFFVEEYMCFFHKPLYLF